MKTKKLISLLLAALMVMSLSAIFASSVSAVSTVIAYNEPAIPAITGEKVDLSSCDVQFTDSKTVSGKDITWKNGDKAITSFTPSAKGVTKLTASSGSDSKSIYVVAKDKSDKNYVLYYNDFSSADSIADWKKDSGKESFISVSDGKLVIDAVNSDLTRILLPEWLGEFGNYRIDISEMMSECRDASRWSSIAYRIQNNTYPYYHMCIRKNFAAGSGIEFAIRNTSNAWEVLSTGSYTENQTDGKYYKCSVSTKNDTIMHSVNDTDIVFVKLDKGYMQGRIAIQANYCKLNIDEITVSLQLETPKKDVGPTVIDTTATVENISNALTNVAYINKESDLTSLSSSAMSAILTVGGDNIVDDKGAKLFALSDTFEKIGNSIIPIFRVNSKADADKAIAFLTSKNTFDAAILSSDPEIVKYARNKSVNLRGIIDFTEKYNKPLTNEQMAEIRLAVNGSKSKTALLDISCLTKPVVAELQALLLTVWASDSDLKNTAEAACLIISGAHGVVTNKPATVKESYSFFKKNTLTRTPLIIGHRGNPTNAPDNSISSYLKAVENGANVVETDIYITKDNEVIILHDGTLDRTTNGTGHVENMTLAEIKKFFLWGDNDKYKNQFPNEKVPTLREMFEALKDKDTKIFIEVKGGQKLLIDKMVALIKELNYQSKVCVISFNIDQLVYLQTLMPEISCGYLLSNLGYAADDESANAELYKQLLLIQPKNTTYNVSANNQSKQFISACNDRGVTVWPWTYRASGAKQFLDAFTWGYNGLTTDDAQYSKLFVKTVDTTVSNLIFNLDTDKKSEKITINSKNYARVSKDVSSEAKAIILYGDDVITADNGTITAKKAGTASVMFGYEAKLPNGSKYTLYTMPIDVVVNEKSGETSSTTSGSDLSKDSSLGADESKTEPTKKSNTTLIIVICAIVAAGAIGGGAFFYIKKKKIK